MKDITFGIGVVSLSVVLITTFLQNQSRTSFVALNNSEGISDNSHSKRELRTPGQQKIWLENQRLISKIWIERNKQKNETQVLKFLDDTDIYTRTRAVCILGRMESISALPRLVTLEKKMKSIKTLNQYKASKAVPIVPLKLAIGRIESRNESGQKRFDALARRVGLEWKNVIDISQRFSFIADGRSRPPMPATNQEKQVLYEIFDVMYQMKKQGKDISPQLKQLQLPIPFKLWLNTASLPTNQAVDKVLDYIVNNKITRVEHLYLMNSLLPALGNQSLVGLRKKLILISTQPNAGFTREGKTQIIHCVERYNDLSSVPVLEKIAKDKDVEIQWEAKDAIRSIKKKDQFFATPI